MIASFTMYKIRLDCYQIHSVSSFQLFQQKNINLKRTKWAYLRWLSHYHSDFIPKRKIKPLKLVFFSRGTQNWSLIGIHDLTESFMPFKRKSIEWIQFDWLKPDSPKNEEKKNNWFCQSIDSSNLIQCYHSNNSQNILSTFYARRENILFEIKGFSSEMKNEWNGW